MSDILNNLSVEVQKGDTEKVREFVTIAIDQGIAPVKILEDGLRPGMEELIPLCDYVVASEVFARSYAGTPLKALKRLVASGVPVATVTLGAKGSVTIDSRGGREGGAGRFTTPAFKVRAVDSTGAGDVFHGGYIYGLLQGWDLVRTVRFASAASALKCTKPGGRSGIPAVSRVRKFLRERG